MRGGRTTTTSQPETSQHNVISFHRNAPTTPKDHVIKKVYVDIYVNYYNAKHSLHFVLICKGLRLRGFSSIEIIVFQLLLWTLEIYINLNFKDFEGSVAYYEASWEKDLKYFQISYKFSSKLL